MFERHIYSEDFFSFIKEVCESLQLPPTGQYNLAVHPLHVSLNQETKQLLGNLIQILSRLIFHLLAKAQENNVTYHLLTFHKII